MKATFLVFASLLVVTAVKSIADAPALSAAAANIDWEKVRATPAKLSVLNMELVPLVVSKEKSGWLSVPQRLLSHKTQIFRPTGTTNGAADYTVTADGYMLVACNYDYQGNASGSWQEEAWSVAAFRAHGWVEASELELGGRLVSPLNRAQKIFAKHVKAGESGRLRCNKHDPPFIIVCSMSK